MNAALTVELHTRDDLATAGIGYRELARLVKGGELLAVRPGIYAFQRETESLTDEQRTVVRARALCLVSDRTPVFCALTSAILRGIPVAGRLPKELHVMVEATRPGAAAGVIRHGDGGWAPRVEASGPFLLTDLARTVADVARIEPFDTAVCVSDGALARVAAPLSVADDPGTEDDEAESLRSAALARAEPFRYGRAKANRVLEFARHRADGPGESISRIRLHQLGYSVRLQVPVPGPRRGSHYWIDFDVGGSWGEFDGRVKYRAVEMLRGKSAADVLDDEKQREDWIRGTTQRSLARWMWEDVRSPAALGARLRAFHIPPP